MMQRKERVDDAKVRVDDVNERVGRSVPMMQMSVDASKCPCIRVSMMRRCVWLMQSTVDTKEERVIDDVSERVGASDRA
jgi:hypothetical protein